MSEPGDPLGWRPTSSPRTRRPLRAARSRPDWRFPALTADGTTRRWAVRRTDLDPFGHVNNAATWAFLEEAAELDASERVGRAEMEYLQPVEYDETMPDLVTQSDGSDTTAWLVTETSVRAAGRWTPAGD